MDVIDNQLHPFDKSKAKWRFQSFDIKKHKDSIHELDSDRDDK